MLDLKEFGLTFRLGLVWQGMVLFALVLFCFVLFGMVLVIAISPCLLVCVHGKP